MSKSLLNRRFPEYVYSFILRQILNDSQYIRSDRPDISDDFRFSMDWEFNPIRTWYGSFGLRIQFHVLPGQAANGLGRRIWVNAGFDKDIRKSTRLANTVMEEYLRVYNLTLRDLQLENFHKVTSRLRHTYPDSKDLEKFQQILFNIFMAHVKSEGPTDVHGDPEEYYGLREGLRSLRPLNGLYYGPRGTV